MKTSPILSSKFCGMLGLIIAVLPSLSHAQAGAGRGQGGAGMNLGGMAQQLQKVLDQLDLTDEQKPKIDAIMKKTQGDVREAMQGLQDADPQDRRQKMQDILNMMNDAKKKIEAELTPEQLKKFYPLNAKMLLKRATDTLAAYKTASVKIDVGDDVKKQLTDLFDDTNKTLDGYKPDAEAVSDSASETDFQQKLLKVQLDMGKQVRDILGQEDAQKLQQSVRQSMAAGGGGAGGGRGQGGQGQGARRRLNGGKPATQPTTQPDAN